MATSITGLTANALIEAVFRRGIVYIVNGYDQAKKLFEFNGTETIQNLGLEPIWKDNVLSLSGTTAGSMTGTYAGCITGYNGKIPILLESNASPIETVAISSKKLKFTWDASAFDSQVTDVRCYCTIAGGAASLDNMFYVGTATVATESLEVDLSDSDIEAGAVLDQRNSPPLGRYAHICLHKERIVLANRTRSLETSGTATSGNTTSLTASALQNYETDYFVGMWVLIRRGLGTEEYRQVTAYNPTTGALTFATLSTTVSASDAYEIYENSGPTEVVWSEPDKPEVFPADNVVSIDTGIMEEITAIVSFHSHVIAFSRHMAVRIYIETGSYEVIPLNCGCVSSRTVKAIRGTLWWLSDRGVMMLRPDWSLENMTIRLKHDFTDDLNAAVDYKACAEYHEERYYIAFATGGNTKNNELWCYDLVAQGWFGPRVYPFKIMSLASAVDANGASQLYAGVGSSDPGNKVRLLNFGTTDLGSIQPSKNAGTATAGSTTTVTDTLQSWTTNQFAGAKVRVKRASMGLYEDSVIASNTATILTFSPAIGFTPVAGDTYEIGVYDSILETSELDFGEPAEAKRLLFTHVHLENEDNSALSMKVGACRDFEQNAFKETDVDKNRTFAKVYMGARGKHFRIRIRDSGVDSVGQLKNIVAEAEVDRGQE